MANSSSKRKISNNDIALGNSASYILKSPNGVISEHEVDETNHYRFSTTKAKGEIFNVGGGSIFVTETEYELDYGTYTLTPRNDFMAWVSLVGGGGGGTEPSGGTYGGGGGFTRALVKFQKEIPYSLVIGEGAAHANRSSHGGGGRGHSGGGDGGGLSGLFFNVETSGGRAPWGHTYNTPVKRHQAIAIAGGGGGKGHHGQAHHGAGGGGGGYIARSGHNANGGTQHGGGWAGYNNGGTNGGGHEFHGGHAYQASSWQGGGGGGWYGGGGGGHSGVHHNGGGGGSGHHAVPQEVSQFSNNDLSKYIVNAHTQTSAVGQNYNNWKPANWLHPYIFAAGRNGNHVGRGAHNNDTTNGSRHGKIWITFAPPEFEKFYKPSVNKAKTTPQHDNFNQGVFNYDRI
jgi:hypothetical protein